MIMWSFLTLVLVLGFVMGRFWEKTNQRKKLYSSEAVIGEFLNINQARAQLGMDDGPQHKG